MEIITCQYSSTWSRPQPPPQRIVLHSQQNAAIRFNQFNYCTNMACSYYCDVCREIIGEQPLPRPEAPHLSSSVCLQQLCNAQLLRPCAYFSCDKIMIKQPLPPKPKPVDAIKCPMLPFPKPSLSNLLS